MEACRRLGPDALRYTVSGNRRLVTRISARTSRDIQGINTNRLQQVCSVTHDYWHNAKEGLSPPNGYQGPSPDELQSVPALHRFELIQFRSEAVRERAPLNH